MSLLDNNRKNEIPTPLETDASEQAKLFITFKQRQSRESYNILQDEKNGSNELFQSIQKHYNMDSNDIDKILKSLLSNNNHADLWEKYHNKIPINQNEYKDITDLLNTIKNVHDIQQIAAYRIQTQHLNELYNFDSKLAACEAEIKFWQNAKQEDVHDISIIRANLAADINKFDDLMDNRNIAAANSLYIDNIRSLFQEFLKHKDPAFEQDRILTEKLNLADATMTAITKQAEKSLYKSINKIMQEITRRIQNFSLKRLLSGILNYFLPKKLRQHKKENSAIHTTHTKNTKKTNHTTRAQDLPVVDLIINEYQKYNKKITVYNKDLRRWHTSRDYAVYNSYLDELSKVTKIKKKYLIAKGMRIKNVSMKKRPE